MTKKSRKAPLKNIAVSVNDKLLRLAKQKNEDFIRVLLSYANERLLQRLSQSQYANSLVLKGGTLFAVKLQEAYRPTKDIDFTAVLPNELQNIKNVFEEILRVECEDDGLAFDFSTLSVEEILDEAEYGGIRVKVIARLAAAKIHMQIDVGFGDAVKPTKIVIPSILDYPPIEVICYPDESVIAEKYEAMVALGMVNTRMKDFFDIYQAACKLPFDGKKLADSIEATFKTRDTTLPSSTPTALTTEFLEDTDKVKQWKAFIKKNKLNLDVNLTEVGQKIRDFVIPPSEAARTTGQFKKIWGSKGSWED